MPNHNADRDHGERIATLEVQMASYRVDFDKLEDGQRAILLELTRYKGAVGAATFIVSCLFAFFTLGRDWVIAHWK